ncbi:MAG: SDR family oxidoreductase [Armatimonadota bacterium]|nr:SDR family oxidoreductase [bacterium]
MSGILVLGGAGMLGHKMTQTLRRRFPDTACTIKGSLNDSFYSDIDLFKQGPVVENVDAMDWPALEQMLREQQPDVIVNCIGIIKQRDEAHSAIPSITINSLLPHKLAEAAAEWGGRVIHFSTDCVFSGKKGCYTEDDPSDAEDLYGKSKYLGEVTAANALTLRTSIIGRELSNFKSLLEWFLSQNGKTVRGFTKVYYSGVTTNHLSEVVADVIEKFPKLSGLYQVTSNTISKHDLLCLIRDAYNMSVEIVPEDDTFSDRSMIGDKFNSATGRVCPAWPELVAQLANDPTPYRKP